MWVLAVPVILALYFWAPWPANWPETLMLLICLACVAVMDVATR